MRTYVGDIRRRGEFTVTENWSGSTETTTLPPITTAADGTFAVNDHPTSFGTFKPTGQAYRAFLGTLPFSTLARNKRGWTRTTSQDRAARPADSTVPLARGRPEWSPRPLASGSHDG